MKRTLLVTTLCVVGLMAVLVLAVNLRTRDVARLPPPDPARLIDLPDGRSLPLARLLELDAADPSRRHSVAMVQVQGPAAPVQPLVVAEPPGGAPEAGASLDAAALDFAATLYPGMRWGSVFKLGEYHRMHGDLDQALALFLSVRPDDRDFAQARRRIALDILTLGRHDPDSAVSYANQAFHVNPLDPDSWEVLARVYSGTLGLSSE